MPARGKTSGIPAPVGIKDPAVTRILWAVREKLENADQSQTIKDIQAQLSGLTGPGGFGAGTGTGKDGIPLRPVAAKNLQAHGIFGAIILTIDATPAGAAYNEWLANTVDDLGTATLVGTSTVPIYQHYVGDGQGRYYWVRGVGYSNPPLRGPINKTAGTFGKAGVDPTYLKDILDGQIGESQLASSLAAKITANGIVYKAKSNVSVGASSLGMYNAGGNRIATADIGFTFFLFDSAGNYQRSTNFYIGDANYNSTNSAANFINSTGFNTVVVVTNASTGYYLNDAFYDAMETIGATREVLKGLGNKTQYVLIGHGDAGSGGGLERTDPSAIEQPFQIIQGYPAQVGAGPIIKEQRSMISGLGAEWTLKVQTSNGGFTKVSGIGLASAPVGSSGVQSKFYIEADQLAVIDPADTTGASATIPFAVSGGNIYANMAIFKAASITSAMIKNLNANQIVASSLSAISANLGTVSAGTFKTDGGSAGRVEVSSSGYPLWIGSGSKTAANANLYVDGNGKLTVNQLNVIGTAQVEGHAITFPNYGASSKVFSRNNDNFPDYTWVLVFDYAITPKTRQVDLTFSGQYQCTAQDADCTVKMRITNGSRTLYEDQLGNLYGDTVNGPFSIPILDNQATKNSSNTYRMYVYTNANYIRNYTRSYIRSLELRDE